jgi:hypothetical protein
MFTSLSVPQYQSVACLPCTPSGDNLPFSNLAPHRIGLERLSVGLVALSTLCTCCALPPALAIGHFGQSIPLSVEGGRAACRDRTGHLQVENLASNAI